MRLRTASMRSVAVGAPHLLFVRSRLLATRSSCACRDHRRWASRVSSLRCALILRASPSAAAFRAPGSVRSPRIGGPLPKSASAPSLPAAADRVPGECPRPRIACPSRVVRLPAAPVFPLKPIRPPRCGVGRVVAAASRRSSPPWTSAAPPPAPAAFVPLEVREVPVPGRWRPSAAPPC